MSRKTVVLVAIAAFIDARPAAALQLCWPSGARDLTVAEARACTLLVKPQTPLEALPTAWRLVFVAEGMSDVPLEILSDSDKAGVVFVCDRRSATSPSGTRAHADTVFECPAGGLAPVAAARYLLQVEGGASARIKFLPTDDLREAAFADASVDSQSEVTINGGTARPYPPLPISATLTRSGNDVLFSASGFDLDGVQSATFVDSRSQGRTSLAVVRTTTGSVVARIMSPAPVPGGYLELEDGIGQVGSISVAPEEYSKGAERSTEHLLVRFRSQQVDLPPREVGLTTGLCRFSSSDLRDSILAIGVDSLERAIPSFRHEDVNSTNLAGEPVILEDLADLYVAHLSPPADAGEARSRLSRLPGVAYSCLDYRVQGMFAPNDSLYPQQWGLHPVAGSICGFPTVSTAHMNADSAWDLTTGSPSVRVAILDTGIDPGHPEIGARTEFGPNFTGDGVSTNSYDDASIGHGTAVAGIALATGNNGSGVAGVAWNARPVAVKVLDKFVSGWALAMARGIDWTRSQRIPIVNMSLGFSETHISPDSIRYLGDICLNAFLSGQMLVAAAGNIKQDLLNPQTEDDTTFRCYPAAYQQRAFAVGAILPDGTRWRDHTIQPLYCEGPGFGSCYSSNFGVWLDVVAPGGRFIATTRDSGRY